MATLGLFASWATALFAGWALVAALAADTPAHPVRQSAERALLASALAAFVAAIALAALLAAGDFTISYVARSATRNLAASYRLAALWNLPAGAVLPTASLVAIGGWIVARRATSALATAAVAAVVVALCAASLAASPFATLPWRPTDGLGLRPALQHPLSVVGAISLSVAVATAAARLAAAASSLASAPSVIRTRVSSAAERLPIAGASSDPAMVLTAAALAIACWSTARGTFMAGVTASPSPIGGNSGAFVAAVTTLVLAWRGMRGSAAARFASSLGLVGILSALLLGAYPRPGSAVTSILFPVLSLLVSAGGAMAAEWENDAMLERVPGVLAALAFALAGSGAMRMMGAGSLAGAEHVNLSLALGSVCLVAAEGARHAASERRQSVWVALASLAGGGIAVVLASRTPTGAAGPVMTTALISVAWSAVAGGAVALMIVSVSRRTLREVKGALVALAVAFAALAAAGEGWATGSATAVAGGATLTAAAPIGADFVIAHQGISRYEDGNAHVEGVALDVSRGERHVALLSADRREYVDSRGELLGPATSRPAILTTPLQELRVHLDDVAADETASVRVVVAPLALAWLAAPICLVLLSASLLVPGGAVRSPYASTDIVLA